MMTTIDIEGESPENFSEQENESAVQNKEKKCTVISSTDTNSCENLESQDCIDTDDSGQNIDENSKYRTELNQNCVNSKEENDTKDEDLEGLIETELENIDNIKLMECPEEAYEPNAEPMIFYVKGAQEGVPNDIDSITDYQETNIEARHSSAIDDGSHNNEDQSDEPDQQAKQNYTTDNDISVNINHSVFVNIQQSDSHLNGGPTQEFSDNDSKGRHQDEDELPTIAEDVFGMNATFDTKKGFKEEQETVNEPTCVFEDVSHPDGINLHTTIHKSDLLGNRDQAQECPDPVSPKDYKIDEENEIKSCDISKAAGAETTFSTDNKVEHVLDEQIDEEPEDLSTSKMIKISSDCFGDIQVKKTEDSVMVQTEKEVVCTEEKRRRFCFPNVPFTKSQIKNILLHIFMSLFIQQLYVHPKSVEQTSLTCVKYHNSTHNVEVCVYALGYGGPTYVPPDIPPNELPNLPQPNLIQTINQQVMAAHVAPGVRARMPQRRHVTNDGRNISLAVARNRMNRIESSAGDVAAGTNNSYFSLRDNPLSITIRHEINHSTLPLPPTSQLESVNTRESNVSENNTNLPSTVPLPPMTANSGHSTVSENNTHLPGAGTCSSRRANDELEKLPCGEIQSGWISADGVRTSVQEVPRQSENPQMSDSDTQSGLGSSLLNMTQSSTPLPDVPLGMSNQTARADTFRDGWPHSCLPPMMMASAGFYYTGVQDVVNCFYCGNCLNSWNLGDDPLQEHAKAYPDCNFVISHLRDGSGNENPSRAQIGAVDEQAGLRVQELILNDTGTNREQPHMQRRCAYARGIEEHGQRVQVINIQEALDPHDESGRGAQNRINNGSETAWGGSETAVNSLEPPGIHTADDKQHLNDDTEEDVCAEESADPRQQGRDGVCNTNGTPSFTTAARRRADSQMSSDNEAAQRNPVQQRRTGILSAVMSQRRRVINQPEQHTLIGENNRQRIDNFLHSGDGRRLLDEGFLRTDVAYAVERVLQGNHPLIYMMVLEVLILSRRRRCKKKRAKYSKPT